MPSKKVLLIDGYNVIHRAPELKASLKGGLENARNRLALQVSTWSQTHPAFECVIVFDGDLKYVGGREVHLAGIRCIFSRKSHDGDDEIIRYVKNFKGRTSDIIVVSDDNNVRNNCRAHGASVQPSGYIMPGKSRYPVDRREASADGKGINHRTVAAINKEMRRKLGL